MDFLSITISYLLEARDFLENDVEDRIRISAPSHKCRSPGIYLFVQKIAEKAKLRFISPFQQGMRYISDSPLLVIKYFFLQLHT